MAQSTIQSWRHHIFYWSLALALVSAGVYLSTIAWLNSEWLSRAGCLIVVLGIWASVGSIVQERLLSGRIRWRRRKALTGLRARQHAESTGAEQAQKEHDEIDEAFDRKLADATLDLRMTLGVLEVSLLITGTLLWGFGDLLMALALS